MKSAEIRANFRTFFQKHGHTAVASSSLVPDNDPTLFFTNAGMVQFKNVFTGLEPRDYTRATSIQKCLRVSGKHNDLENVGRTPRHHTLFEMLGNFSFGDYFKKDAIRLAWQFLTEELQIPAEKLWVTVYEEDDDAFELWETVEDLPKTRIQRLGEKDNFWSMGDTGPCGPCSEIFYDHGPEFGEEGGPATESDRYVEIWNLVFMQYDRSADGTLTPLPKPSIDTGAGLERIAAALQGTHNNFDTDCFAPIINVAAKLANLTYGQGGESDVSLRVIADHARATALLIGDGVMPSNEERGYVLRRVMRRAIRFGVKIGLKESFFWKVTDAVIAHMGEEYPELTQRRDFILEVVRGEEERFSETLQTGLILLEKAFAAAESNDQAAVLDGDTAFKLYDTFGFPLDLTQLIAEERGIGVDEEGYKAAMEAQRAAGRAAWKGSGDTRVSAIWQSLAARGIESTFTGYSADQFDGQVVALVRDGEEVQSLTAGESGSLVLDQTPFYGESGGQVGDTGALTAQGMRATVTDTQKPAGNLVVHHLKVDDGEIQVNSHVTASVNADRRNQTKKNHTATHLLHAALREVLGDHVTQKGSLVAPDRLRFDFAHHKAVSPEELTQIEDLVYANVLENVDVGASECSMDEARERGAMALFGEKYGNRVRVIEVPGFSVELCGGTHVSRTGDIGLFRILSESSVAAGVRRLEAVTGAGALSHIRQRDTAVTTASSLLRTPTNELTSSIQRLLDDRKRLEKELEKVKKELSRAQAGDLTEKARDVGGIQMISAEISGDAKALRDEADRLRDKLGSGVVVLGTRAGGSVKLVVTVSKDLAGKSVHAGNLVRDVAKLVGGGGGGRPDMAQAGGRDPEKLPHALEQAYALVAASQS